MAAAETLEAHMADLRKLQSETYVRIRELEQIIKDIKQLSATTVEAAADVPPSATDVKNDSPQAMTLNDRFRLMRGDTN